MSNVKLEECIKGVMFSMHNQTDHSTNIEVEGSFLFLISNLAKYHKDIIELQEADTKCLAVLFSDLIVNRFHVSHPRCINHAGVNVSIGDVACSVSLYSFVKLWKDGRLPNECFILFALMLHEGENHIERIVESYLWSEIENLNPYNPITRLKVAAIGSKKWAIVKGLEYVILRECERRSCFDKSLLAYTDTLKIDYSQVLEILENKTPIDEAISIYEYLKSKFVSDSPFDFDE